MQTLNVRATVYALVALAAIAYAVCTLFQPFFATWPMYDVVFWQTLFPGFSWTPGGVLIGLVWTVVYAAASGWIFAGVYNFFAKRQIASGQDAGKHVTT
jgi:hypothetical protein